jgi:Mor family transcriptional regulator
MAQKGRAHKVGMPGVSNRSAKLSEDQVREIIRRKTAGETQISLAREYEMSQQQISHLGRTNWIHLSANFPQQEPQCQSQNFPK